MPHVTVEQISDVVNKADGHIGQGDWAAAIGLLDKILEGHDEDPRIFRAIIRAYLMRGFCHSEQTNMDLSRKDFEKALSYSLAVKEMALEAQSRARLANVLWKTAEREKALEQIGKAIVISAKVKDPWLDGFVSLEQATIHMLSEKPQIIDKVFRNAILSLERAGDLRELSRAYNNFATNFLYRLDFKKASELFGKAKKIAQRAAYAPMVAWGSFNIAGCLSELGRFDEALKELDEAFPILERTHDIFGQQGAHEIYGVLYAKKKDWSRSEEHFLIARNLAIKCKMPLGEAKTLYNMGRMYKWRGDKARALRFLKESKEMFERLKSPSDAEIAQKEMQDIS